MNDKRSFENIMDEISSLDSKEEVDGLNDEERSKRCNLKIQLASFLKEEKMMWRQNPREKWLEEGERNTKYFHAMASHRCRINYIEEIVVDNKKIGRNTTLLEAAGAILKICIWRPMIVGQKWTVCHFVVFPMRADTLWKLSSLQKRV